MAQKLMPNTSIPPAGFDSTTTSAAAAIQVGPNGQSYATLIDPTSGYMAAIDSSGRLSFNYTASSISIGTVKMSDGVNGSNLATVAQFHNVDNQNPGSTGYGLLTGGVAQLLNQYGYLDRQREVSTDNIAPTGIATGGTTMAMAFPFNSSSGSYTASPTVSSYAQPISLTPTNLSGTLNGIPWNISTGSVLTIDSGTAQEVILVTQVNSTTAAVNLTGFNGYTLTNGLAANSFAAVCAKAHNGSGTPFAIKGFTYNIGRDAAGELDLATGAGTAVAAEYEFDGTRYQRGRNIQGIGVHINTCTTNASSGSNVVLQLVSSLPANLQVGAPILVDVLGGTNPAELAQIVAFSSGSKTVTVDSLSAAHNGSGTAFQVAIPIQSLVAAPVNFGGFGIDAAAEILYSGINATSGLVQYSVAKDINAVGYNSGNTPSANSATSAGMGADVEFGVCLTALQTFTNNQLVPDQHGAGGEDLVTMGGRTTSVQQLATINGATSTLVQLKTAGAGRLCRIFITGTGTNTGNISFYDQSGTGAGSASALVYAMPCSVTAGTILDLQIPFASGLAYSVGTSSTANPTFCCTLY